MGQITEQTIINAILALDVEKLKEIEKVLAEEYIAKREALSNCCKIIKTLESAELSKCDEYKTLCANHAKASEELDQLSIIRTKCNKALNALNP